MSGVSMNPVLGQPLDGWRISPAWLAFIGSLLLSAIAIADSTSVNRDGMLYVDLAQVLLDDGFEAARARFDWLFFPILLAAVSKLTGLSVETSGYLLCSLLMAGTCGLLVRCTVQSFPAAGWSACLVVLGLPAFNEYRDHIIREFGYWFFVMLACWLAIRSPQAPRWSSALGVPIALAIAAAFRVEAIAFYPVIVWWQFYAARSLPIGRRIGMLGIVPGAVLLLALVLFATGGVDLDERVYSYLDPLDKLARFDEGVGRMADSVLNNYSRDSAAYVLFFGLLTMIPAKFFQMMGVFVVPLGYLFMRRPVRRCFACWQPFGWLSLCYLAVLVTFVIDRFFVTGRYVSFLNLLAVPLVAAGLALLLERFPRGRPAVTAIALVAMLANVVSLSPRKMQYLEAGAWLQAQPVQRDRMYIESRRVAYHAGFGYPHPPTDRDAALIDARNGRYELVVLEGAPASDAEMDAWLEGHGLELRARFDGPGDDVVVLAPTPLERRPPASDSAAP